MPINTTATLTTTMKDFYDRNLLEHAKTMFCYANFGQKRSIPKNSSKTVEFRRWNLFTPSVTTQTLTEGVEPNSQSLSMTAVTADVDQYGAWVEYSDFLDLTSYDDIISGATELLGEQLGTVIEWVTRDAILADASTHYCGGRLSTATITGSDTLSIAEVRKCVRSLKNAKARRFTGEGVEGHFVMIVDPDCVYDLQSDTAWLDVRKYQNDQAIYTGEIGMMFGVRFVESTECYVEANAGATPTGGTAGIDIHHSIIMGADAYGTIDVEGSGAIRTIIKPLGWRDALDQNGAIGAKVEAYAAKVLNPLWIIDVQSAASV